MPFCWRVARIWLLGWVVDSDYAVAFGKTGLKLRAHFAGLACLYLGCGMTRKALLTV